MMRGQYHDTVRDTNGRLILDGRWRPNTIAESAWPLIAGLLKNDPGLQGILFWAVGAGEAAWDSSRPSANPAATWLRQEIERRPLPAGSIVYLDSNGGPAGHATSRIEVSLSFTWPETAQTLREFGLFGGDASETKDSGYLVNYVIHPRLDLAPGASLSRRIRLSLRPLLDDRWLHTPRHWLGASPVTDLDGVGAAYAATLGGVGITTVAELAAAEPKTLGEALPLMKAVELRAKARLTLQVATELAPVSGLIDRTVWDIVVTPTATLAADADAAEEEVGRLREQVSALQLTLDNRFLRRLTVGQLAQPR